MATQRTTRPLQAVVATLALAGGIAAAAPIAAATRSGVDGVRTVRMFDFAQGKTDGWVVGAGDAQLTGLDASRPTSTSSLAIEMRADSAARVHSPDLLLPDPRGDRVVFHLYESSTSSVHLVPYVSNERGGTAHLGGIALSPGSWKLVGFDVPSDYTGTLQIGLALDNINPTSTTVDLSPVYIRRPGPPPPSPVVTLPGAPQPNGPTGTWRLVFDDEFNGNSLDTSKWAPDWFGNGGTMNNAGTEASNVSVANGELSLKLSSARTGALVSTNPRGGANPGFEFTYGYAEARIWFPGTGTTIDDWPAFWTDGQSWPADGEIDVAEGLGTLTSNYHNPDGAFNSGTIAGDWAAGWHTYGVNWEPGSITIYWDGKIVRTLTSATTPITSSPQYLILNIGAGEGPTVVGDTLKVDYVRVWQHA